MSKPTTRYLQKIPTGRPNEFIETSAYYLIGGANWFHGSMNARGYYLSASIVTIEDGFKKFMLGAGVMSLVEQAGRFSQKKLDALAERAEFPGTPEALKLAEMIAHISAGVVHQEAV